METLPPERRKNRFMPWAWCWWVCRGIHTCKWFLYSLFLSLRFGFSLLYLIELVLLEHRQCQQSCLLLMRKIKLLEKRWCVSMNSLGQANFQKSWRNEWGISSSTWFIFFLSLYSYTCLILISIDCLIASTLDSSLLAPSMLFLSAPIMMLTRWALLFLCFHAKFWI